MGSITKGKAVMDHTSKGRPSENGCFSTSQTDTVSQSESIVDRSIWCRIINVYYFSKYLLLR